MRFTETNLSGVCIVEPVLGVDSRGFFARTYCHREFAEHGLQTTFVQHSISYSWVKGTLRGMHYQRSPHSEVKLVSCRKGAMWDVVIDLRPASPTYCKWQEFELTDENHRQLYIPEGFAHGFQSLCNGTEVSYLISEYYAPTAAFGVRYNDRLFGIAWPLRVAAISEQDKSWPDFASSPS
jgi:dTDP-4-dehydrorhamnose 3,5-epimerase